MGRYRLIQGKPPEKSKVQSAEEKVIHTKFERPKPEPTHRTDSFTLRGPSGNGVHISLRNLHVEAENRGGETRVTFTIPSYQAAEILSGVRVKWNVTEVSNEESSDVHELASLVRDIDEYYRRNR